MKKSIILSVLLLLIIATTFQAPCNTSIYAAQLLATPTSPAICFPVTPVQPGESWYCVDGTAIVGTRTPMPFTPPPPTTPEPTNTPVSYPGPATPQSIIREGDSLPMPTTIDPACLDAILVMDGYDPVAGGVVDLTHPSVCQITIFTADGDELTFMSDTFNDDYQITGFNTHVGVARRVNDSAPKMTRIVFCFDELQPAGYFPIIISQ
jgi:hypothetical protein